jgi:D-tyrosyl-tRNA(Tyr) deacylase
MRAVVQRVLSARCEVDGQVVSEIGRGLLVFLGIGKGDSAPDIDYIVDKILHLRIFEDENQKTNLSISDVNGSIMVISQFTLYGDVRKGRRPSFDGAMPPEEAERLYNEVVSRLRTSGIKVETGRFREMMRISLINDGPMTILLDSRRLF